MPPHSHCKEGVGAFCGWVCARVSVGPGGGEQARLGLAAVGPCTSCTAAIEKQHTHAFVKRPSRQHRLTRTDYMLPCMGRTINTQPGLYRPHIAGARFLGAATRAGHCTTRAAAAGLAARLVGSALGPSRRFAAAAALAGLLATGPAARLVFARLAGRTLAGFCALAGWDFLAPPATAFAATLAAAGFLRGLALALSPRPAATVAVVRALPVRVAWRGLVLPALCLRGFLAAALFSAAAARLAAAR